MPGLAIYELFKKIDGVKLMSVTSDSRQPNNPTVAIIGGGIMGISLGYYLSREGVQVEIFEASPVLGGLAGPIILPDGTPVDRFYHAILSSDRHLGQLCADLGISDQLRFFSESCS